MDRQDKPKTFMSQLSRFVLGWGFYIVLFLCVAVVGISVWSLVSAGKDAMDSVDNALSAVATSPGSSYTMEDFLSPDLQADAPAPLPPETAPAELPEESTPVSAPPAELPAPEPLKFVWPLNGSVSLPYAVESLVYDKTMADWRSHKGLDIAADLGTKVCAAARGTVTELYDDPLYGTTVVVDHGEGLKSLYRNLAATPTVTVGTPVAAGDVLGAVGATALAEAGDVRHLHFEMELDGESVDPTDYLPGR